MERGSNCKFYFKLHTIAIKLNETLQSIRTDLGRVDQPPTFFDSMTKGAI